MADNLLFAYGTLLTPPIQRAIIGRRIAGKADRLDGFRKTALRDGADSFPNVTPDPKNHVAGHVLQVTERELARIDLYEGDRYVRERVMLASGQETWVYRAPDTSDSTAGG